MMVWSLFIIGLMGLFFYNKIGSIIPMVVLPTTEIIEPQFARLSFFKLYFGAMTSAPPMYGRRTSGMVTEPSSFW